MRRYQAPSFGRDANRSPQPKKRGRMKTMKTTLRGLGGFGRGGRGVGRAGRLGQAAALGQGSAALAPTRHCQRGARLLPSARTWAARWRRRWWARRPPNRARPPPPRACRAAPRSRPAAPRGARHPSCDTCSPDVGVLGVYSGFWLLVLAAGRLGAGGGGQGRAAAEARVKGGERRCPNDTQNGLPGSFNPPPDSHKPRAPAPGCRRRRCRGSG